MISEAGTTSTMLDMRPNPSLTSARSSPLQAAILGMYSSASSRQTSGVRKQALSPTDCINLPTFTPNTLLMVNNPPLKRGLEKALVDQTKVAIPTLVASVKVLTFRCVASLKL